MTATVMQTVSQYQVLLAPVLLSATKMAGVALMWVTFKTVWVRIYIHTEYVLLCDKFYVDADKECVTGEVRLVGGVTNSSSGLLEVCGNGRWGTVCDYRNEWNYENAMVVCRQLNLPTASKCN